MYVYIYIYIKLRKTEYTANQIYEEKSLRQQSALHIGSVIIKNIMIQKNQKKAGTCLNYTTSASAPVDLFHRLTFYFEDKIR